MNVTVLREREHGKRADVLGCSLGGADGMLARPSTHSQQQNSRREVASHSRQK